MITKERLKELIEQGATIYELDINRTIYDLDLRDYQNLKIEEIYVDSLNRLFETKEQAEWHREFGCIERTERLELPTWEENKPIECVFSTPNRSSYFLKSRVKTGYSIERENPYIIRIGKFGEGDNFIDFEFTKENYTLACRKCKELFLGEKE